MPYQIWQRQIQPGFLKKPYGAAWGQSLGLIKDLFSDLVKQGIQQRFVTLAQEDAVAMIGAERGIPQGVNETLPEYVSSILAAWDAWSLGGTPWALLALLNFMGYPDAYVFSQNGNLYGPSGSVVLPNLNAGEPGTPPALVSTGATLTFATNSLVNASQGPQKGILYWQPSVGYALNHLIQPNPPNGFYYKATAAGTSGTTPPAWPTIIGNTVVDNGVTWELIGPVDLAPIGQAQGTVSTSFWSGYFIVFSPTPSSWTDILNPPTIASDPSVYELAAIFSMLAAFNSASATCFGLLVPGAGSRACFGWPTGRTFYGDGGLTSPSADGLTTLWAPHTVIGLNYQRVPTTNNGYWYKATTAGTTGYVEPTWPTTVGLTVSDGSVVWTCEGTTNTFLTGTGPQATVFQFIQPT